MAYTFTRTGAQIEEIHNTVEDPKSNTQFSDDIRTIAGEYRGLWPDTGGSANKGDTYQTQVSGTPTGQYFTALQYTTVEPVGDDVNWRSVVSNQSLGGVTNYQAASVADMIAGNTLRNGTVPHVVGDVWGIYGQWKVKTVSVPMTINDFEPTGNINVLDWHDGSNDHTAAFLAMADAGYCGIQGGSYTLSSLVTFNFHNIKKFNVSPEVIINVFTDTKIFLFKNITRDYDFKGMLIKYNNAQLSQPLVEITGTQYYPTGNEFDTVGQVTHFNNIYALNVQGHAKVNGPDVTNGAAFLISCAAPEGGSAAESITMVWNRMILNATGFYDGFQFYVDGNQYGFMSSCNFLLTSWGCTNALVDIARARGVDNTSAGTGDNYIELNCQPKTGFQKAVKIVNGAGNLSAHFKVHLWDALIFNYANGVIDALASNTYEDTLDNNDYNICNALNYVQGGNYPTKNFQSKLFESDRLYYTNTEIPKYTYMRDIVDTDTALQAMEKIRDNYDNRGINHSFIIEYSTVPGNTAEQEIFKPFLNELLVSTQGFRGKLSLETFFVSGELKEVRFTFETDRFYSSQTYAHQTIQWKRGDLAVYSSTNAFSSGTSDQIKNAKSPRWGVVAYDTARGELLYFKDNGWWTGVVSGNGVYQPN